MGILPFFRTRASSVLSFLSGFRPGRGRVPRSLQRLREQGMERPLERASYELEEWLAAETDPEVVLRFLERAPDYVESRVFRSLRPVCLSDEVLERAMGGYREAQIYALLANPALDSEARLRLARRLLLHARDAMWSSGRGGAGDWLRRAEVLCPDRDIERLPEMRILYQASMGRLRNEEGMPADFYAQLDVGSQLFGWDGFSEGERKRLYVRLTRGFQASEQWVLERVARGEHTPRQVLLWMARRPAPRHPEIFYEALAHSERAARQPEIRQHLLEHGSTRTLGLLAGGVEGATLARVLRGLLERGAEAPLLERVLELPQARMLRAADLEPILSSPSAEIRLLGIRLLSQLSQFSRPQESALSLPAPATPLAGASRSGGL